MKQFFRSLAVCCVAWVGGASASGQGLDGISVSYSDPSDLISLTFDGEEGVAYELHESADLMSWTRLELPLRGATGPMAMAGTSGQLPGFFQIRTYTIYAPEILPEEFEYLVDADVVAEGGISEFERIAPNLVNWTIIQDDSSVDGRIRMDSLLSYEVNPENLNRAEMIVDLTTITASFISSGFVLFKGSPEEAAAEFEEVLPTRMVFDLLFTGIDEGEMQGVIENTDGSSEVIVDTFSAFQVPGGSRPFDLTRHFRTAAVLVEEAAVSDRE